MVLVYVAYVVLFTREKDTWILKINKKNKKNKNNVTKYFLLKQNKFLGKNINTLSRGESHQILLLVCSSLA